MLALLALVPFAVAACGDDDDDDGTDEPATTETDTGDGGGGGGSTVSFTANPDGDLAFEEDSAEATAGPVTIELTNDASVPHDVRIESPDGEDVGGTEEITGDTTTAEVELEPGDYTFYCSVPGHREAGMEGTLTVN
jgi:uncharacterized cupredoxin-like copper-binding protein